MHYRVKFRCYHYNTGAADNHSYIETADFDTYSEAEKFKNRVNRQKDLFDDNSEGWVSRNEAWKKSSDYIKIENGYITGYANIVSVFPEREVDL